MNNKSILEQALLQVQTLEEAVKANAKGILASTMKQELNDLLKESMEEEVPVDEEVSEEEVSETELSEQPESDEEPQDDVPADDAGDEEGLDNELDEPSDEEEMSKNIDDMDSEMNMDDMEPEMDMDDMGMDDEDVVDMTDADDEEILKVFKAMSDEDGIIVKKDGEDIELSDGDDEYIIKLDEEVSEEEDCQECGEMSEEEMGDDETVYEIELDEEESDVHEMELVYELEDEEAADDDMEEGEETPESDVDEASRTFANDVRTPANQGMKYKAGRHEMNEEVETLRKQNDEYKKALVLFKEKLNEVAVFNANLAYATRLFTEHSTTKQEKLNILKRFDSISTLNESKNLYKSIKTELDNKQPISESVVGKLTSAPTTSSSEVLSESKAYENPQFKRMKDLMSKIK